MAQEAMAMLEAAQVRVGVVWLMPAIDAVHYWAAIRCTARIVPSLWLQPVHDTLYISSLHAAQGEIGALQAAKAAAEHELAEVQQQVGGVQVQLCLQAGCSAVALLLT